MPTTGGQAAHVLRIMDEKGMHRDALSILVNGGLLADFFEAAAQGSGIQVSRDDFRMFCGLLPTKFPTPVDYDISIEDLYLLSGFRGGSGIPEQLPFFDTFLNEEQRGVIERTFVLVPVDPKLENQGDRLRRRLYKDNLEPADGRELLAFGIKWPQAMSRHFVVALCPEDRDGENLRMTDGQSGMVVYACINRDISTYCHLLAIKKTT